MPQELFPTEIIKAMIPYADTETAHSLELLLQTEELHTRMGQARESLQGFWELMSTAGTGRRNARGRASERAFQRREASEGKEGVFSEDSEEDGEYELAASELGGSRGGGIGQQMDLEGMIQAVQAVCTPGDRQRLDQLLMLLRVRKFLYSSHNSSSMLEAMTAFLSPEQKKQIDEILPLMSMMMQTGG